MRKHLPPELYSEEAYRIAPSSRSAKLEATEPWSAEDEGQLSLDISETAEAFIIIAPIAGVLPENLEVAVSHDTVTIKGRREERKETADGEYLLKECHWGSFSRTAVLPGKISAKDAQAVLRGGILTITLPKEEPEALLQISEAE